MGWVVIGVKPSLFIRESYDKGKHWVREVKKVATTPTEKERKRRKELTVLKNRNIGDFMSLEAT